MTLEIYRNFLQALGRKVITDNGCLWCQVARGFYHGFPVHEPLHPSSQQLEKLFRRERALGVRFSADAAAGGKASFVYLCEKPAYDLNLLSANHRSKVRRGLKQCRLGPITDAEYFRVHGWPLQAETLQRQNRPATLERQEWEKIANCIGRFSGLEIWGAWFENALASFIVTFQVDDCVHLLTFRSANQYLRYYPNDALIYTVVSEMLSRPQVQRVSFGEESLQGLESLDAFKTGMGFRRHPIHQKIVLNPVIAPFFNRLTRRWIGAMNARRPQSPFWRKAAGVVELL